MSLRHIIIIALLLFLNGCSGGGNSSGTDHTPIVVNTLEDIDYTNSDIISLRSALKTSASGQPITFDPGLDDGIINLSLTGETGAVLKGEVMGMREEESGPVSYLVGYFERNYGRSALHARKNVIIDASSLPSGITLTWTGGNMNPARILSVYGDLTMKNVKLTGGYSITEDISHDNPDQSWTLARGGALAVWGHVTLVNCTLYNNHCIGDFGQSRDRGSFGGGLYADTANLKNCIISGNTVTGAGAAGGGVYSVGGAESGTGVTVIKQSSITGNRIGGLFVYGAGIYSDGGGIGKRNLLTLESCTIADNLAEPSPGLPSYLLGMGYWRGGGVYMSNGYLNIKSCTITQNDVYGVPRTDDLDKPNLAGGVAATIGNAHAVEEMTIGQSIITGNRVYELQINDESPISYNQDIFTGSLLHFNSDGHNRIGIINFNQILVPVGQKNWESLSRKHFPKTGDEDFVDAGDVLDLTHGITYSETILSAGVNTDQPAILFYEPQGSALDQVSPSSYSITNHYSEYEILSGGTNNFIEIFLNRVEDYYELSDTGFVDDLISGFETYLNNVDLDDAEDGLQPYTDPSGSPILTLSDTQWFGPSVTWPKETENYPYIEFWHRFDSFLEMEGIPDIGQELIGDDVWKTLFSNGPLSENPYIEMDIISKTRNITVTGTDQRGTSRPVNSLCDIGAIEAP